MANLIVSILAIALTSILCVIGISYVGTIYAESQADAQASELVANATKVAGAMRSWVNANGSTTLQETTSIFSSPKTCSNGRAACWETGTALDLTSSGNNYLDALPQLGSYAQGNGSSDYYFKAIPIANVAWANEGTKFDSLFAVITSVPVCKAIARLARGDAATPWPRAGVVGSTMGDFSTVMNKSEFDCIYNDSNSNGTLDSGESMFFIYKVL